MTGARQDARAPRLLTCLACAAGLWLCAAGGVARGEAPQSPGSVRPLRLVTLNLYHGGPFSGLGGDARNLETRLATVREALARLDVDIVGLQEASTGRGRGHVAARLAGGLGFHHVYAPSNPRIFGGGGISGAIAALLNFTEGPAILSRFPVQDWRAHPLPACGRLFERRTLLSAILDTPGGPMRVHSAHTLGDPCQTVVVADLVRSGRGPLPGVLMGDFNAVEESPAVAVFTRQAGFVDAYRAANPGQPGFTVWQRIAEPSPTVRRRVDYLFVVPGEAVQGRVLASEVILNVPQRLPDGSTLWPSDHYGVLADLQLEEPPRRLRGETATFGVQHPGWAAAPGFPAPPVRRAR